MTDNKNFDVIIIGGSYAGLSAAMTLGRSLKNVLIIDSEKPCNRYTPHSHNFITQDGSVPGEIAAKAKEQVLKYNTVEFLTGLAVSGKKTADGFIIVMEAGETFNAKKLIFAAGIKDILPDIKGFADCWGISVIHCPYCHGYEYRQQKTGVMANGDRAIHLASLVNNLTDNITIFTEGKANFTDEQIVKLNKHDINITEDKISAIEHENGYLKHVVFDNGRRIRFDAVYAALPFEQHSDIPSLLGCEISEQGYIKVDMGQKTTVPGVFACGDSTNMMRSVAYAIATGNIAGAMVNKELADERFG